MSQAIFLESADGAVFLKLGRVGRELFPFGDSFHFNLSISAIITWQPTEGAAGKL